MGFDEKNIITGIHRFFSVFLFLLIGLVLSHGIIPADEKEPLLKIQGSYLAYSYDFNWIYGESVSLFFSDSEVTSRFLKIDLSSQIFYAYGSVRIRCDGKDLEGEEFYFDPKTNKGILVRFSEKIELIGINDTADLTDLTVRKDLSEMSLERIKDSFLYFTCPIIEIRDNFDVFGYEVTLYLEGIPSLGFKRFKLSEGFKQRSSGFSLDSVWYSKSQGITARGSFLYEKENKVNSLSQLRYEERSVLKNYTGADRQADFMTSTTLTPHERLNLGVTGNYNTSGLWNSNFWLNRVWNDTITTNLDFSYNKPINLKGEAWIGLQSTFNAGRYGSFFLAGRYEFQGQVLSNFSYGNTFFNSLNFLLNSTYSRLKIGNSEFSEILSGAVSLSYNPRIFNISSDYYLNYDLFGNQLLTQPQLQIGLTPVSLYGGLLSAAVNNIFIYNHLKRADETSDTYSNNTMFNLSLEPIYLQKNFRLNLTASIEQFLEKQGRNFTTGGMILNVSKELFKGFFLEGYYNLHSRRRTRGWLLEGTTSQDISATIRVDYGEGFNSWMSFSYDPKDRQWRQAFADLEVGIVKNWRFHSQINYDFIIKKINNIDLYLIREAGRVQLRFIYRSLSRQFLVELSPR